VTPILVRTREDANMSTDTARPKKREAGRRERRGNTSPENEMNQNVGDTERVVSSILGGALLIGGLTKRSLPGLALAATGVAFLFRAATGYCTVYESLGLDTHRNTLNSDRSSGQPHKAAARLEESMKEKLPSSKPRRKPIAKTTSGKKGVDRTPTLPSLSKK
jgi:hypothetical protein